MPANFVERSDRLKKLASSVFSDMERAKQRAVARGQQVINLSVGSPDLPPAAHILERLHTAVDNPHNYIYPMGDLPEFRQAVAEWYAGRFGTRLDPRNQVVGLTGSQDGLAHVCLAVGNPGDIVLVPDPGYPIYTAGPVLAGMELYPLPRRPENNYLPDLEAIPGEVRKKARVLLLNYPSNPLAATSDLEFFARVVDFARENQVIVCHDAAYSELTFDGYRPPSFLQSPGALEVGIEFNSLSKTFNMAGCRIGYAVGNPQVIAALAEVKSHVDYGIFRPIQEAAIAALTGPQEPVREMARTYQQRRDAMVEGLAALGWKIPVPKATMFCWAPLPHGWQSYDFALQLVERTGVTVVPGVGFGELGEGYVRIALVQDVKLIREAVQRFASSGIFNF
ncbi:MAG: aminotransferase class I/II-fold pyridoxal phosphate-dependent enzyme [Firmicutes bacterium]|nr:aminotransferase class I/II-fold pyridoxal phosphate-dependent enzyme [Bacillota bacterium]